MSSADALALQVFARMPGGELLHAGRLLSRNLSSLDHKQGFFQYNASYLAHPAAYSLDPVHLPLGPGTFNANRGESGIHAIFDDSLPDAWGRSILAKRAGLDKTRFNSIHLLAALAGDGLGRLLYADDHRVSAPACRDASLNWEQIAAAIQEAGLFERDMDTENQTLQHLLACGSSAGGARPKVLVRKDHHLWLAKFSSIRDPNPALLVALEQAGMLLAKKTGLEIPELQRLKIAERDILLIRRFDVAPEGGRNAMVSMRTLTGVENPYLASYGDMAEVVRSVSSQPDKDLAALFRWMSINVLLQNTDDHLQNFSMLHTSRGWRLSPGYDITPNIHQDRHILRINGIDGPFSRQDLLIEGRQFGLSAQKCRRLFDEVFTGLASWEMTFEQCGVPWEHTRNLRADLHRRRSSLEAISP
ncbi:MAG: type II toxin-antitoxin system HipA family toxin [Pseudomonadota bacterium]